MHIPVTQEIPEEQPDRRNSPRFKVSPIMATLLSDVFIDPVQVINVGRLGFSARSFICYHPGKPVTLSIDGFPEHPSHIVWCSRGTVGARFDNPLDENELLNLILSVQQPNPSQTNKAPTSLPLPVLAVTRRRGR
jgi:hypothetical protein